jgi:hypothetical protein
MTCIKSKKVLKYQQELQDSVDKLTTIIISLRHDLNSSTYTEDKGSLEDYVKEMNDKTDEIYYLEKLIQQTLAELGDEVYINIYEGNTVTPYEVVEMITPKKWMVKKVGDDKIVAIYKGNKTNNFTLNKNIGVVSALPVSIK